MQRSAGSALSAAERSGQWISGRKRRGARSNGFHFAERGLTRGFHCHTESCRIMPFLLKCYLESHRQAEETVDDMPTADSRLSMLFQRTLLRHAPISLSSISLYHIIASAQHIRDDYQSAHAISTHEATSQPPQVVITLSEAPAAHNCSRRCFTRAHDTLGLLMRRSFAL
jgi:hypothetical protein